MGTMSKHTMEGYFWHYTCIYGPPGGIRDDDAGEPDRGTFVDRAITMGQARLLDKGDAKHPFCHTCLKLKDRSPPGGRNQEDFVVLGYELSAALCSCYTTHHGFKHDGNRRLADKVWQDAGAKKGAKQMDKLVCGDCWYKDNNLPPDERRSMEVAAPCSNCGDPSLEVVVIASKHAEGMVIDIDEIDEGDDPRNYEVRIRWTRRKEITVSYEHTLDDLDGDDLDAIREGDFHDPLWDIASEESDGGSETGIEEDYGFTDGGPEDLEWELVKK